MIIREFHSEHLRHAREHYRVAGVGTSDSICDHFTDEGSRMFDPYCLLLGSTTPWIKLVRPLELPFWHKLGLSFRIRFGFVVATLRRRG